MYDIYLRSRYGWMDEIEYRSGPVNLKSFVSKILLRIKWNSN